MDAPAAGSWVGLALLGGAAALDGTSWGQFMLSRPLVAATLGGLLMGAPAEGAMLGAVLEALHLGVLPVGASRYPEGGPPAVAAGALFALSGGTGTMLVLSLLFALVWEAFCGWTVQRLRHFNVRFSVPEGSAAADPARLARGHLAAMGVDFARGAALTVAGAALLLGAAAVVPPDALPDRLARLLAGAVAAAALGAALRSFGGQRAGWFAGGAACALLFWVLR